MGNFVNVLGFQRSASSHPKPTMPISPKKRAESSGWSRPHNRQQQCEPAAPRTEPEPPRSRPRHRSHVRQRESSGPRSEVQQQRRERSCDTNTMTCPMCDGKFATWVIQDFTDKNISNISRLSGHWLRSTRQHVVVTSPHPPDTFLVQYARRTFHTIQ